MGKKAIEELVPRVWDLRRVLMICGSFVLLFFAQSMTSFLQKFYARKSVERLLKDLRERIFHKLLIFSESQRSPYASGKAVNHVVADVQVINELFYIIVGMVKEPITILALLVYLFMIEWRLALICALAVYPVSLIGKYLGKSTKKNQRKIQESLEKISQHTSDSIIGMRTAHVFNSTDSLKSEAKELIDESYKYHIRLARAEEASGPLSKSFFAFLGAAILFGGNFMVSKLKILEFPELIAFITAAGLLQAPFRELNRVKVKLQRVFASLERVVTLLETPLDSLSTEQNKLIESAEETQNMESISKIKEICFQKISYSYDFSSEKRDFAVKNFNLNLEAGKRYALVGESGSGKSTLALLLMRLIDPSQGEILMNGKNIQELNLIAYRKLISYVSQEVHLFNKSIRENLIIAKPSASDSELYAALEKAQIRNFIESLPNGLETIISNRAQNISGGEKQRFALARAFLKDSPILILDEATSQLDAQNEKLIQESLHELIKNKTVLTIAHRLSTIKNSDMVLVMSKGEIIELGDPQQLLSNSSSEFTQLWNFQHDKA